MIYKLRGQTKYRSSTDAKVGLLLTAWAIKDTGNSSMTIFNSIRSCAPKFNSLFPSDPNWTYDLILERALSCDLPEESVFWRLIRELWDDWKATKGVYTGNEKKLDEIIELADGLRWSMITNEKYDDE